MSSPSSSLDQGRGKPGSCDNLPPSPPLSPKHASSSPASASTSSATAPADQLFNLLRDLYLGKADRAALGDWYRLPIAPAGWEAVQARLKDQGLLAWFEDKVRYDYDGQIFILRMPTAVHEEFIGLLELRIHAGIEGLADALVKSGHDEIANHVRKIYPGRSTTLKMEAPKLVENSGESQESQDSNDREVKPHVVERSPDAIFKCDIGPDEPSLYPSLVLEVSYSQKRKDLRYLAESYIVDSEHDTRCVLGLDLTYAPPSSMEKKNQAAVDLTATLSIWRPAIIEGVGRYECHEDARPFRESDGAACEGDLQLFLEDLLPPALLIQYQSELDKLRDHFITISFADLTSYLQHAERSRSAKPSKPTALRPASFGKRKRTPPEELSDGRETTYARLEKDDEDRQSEEDAAWVDSARRARRQEGASMEVVERRQSKRLKGRRGGE